MTGDFSGADSNVWEKKKYLTFLDVVSICAYFHKSSGAALLPCSLVLHFFVLQQSQTASSNSFSACTCLAIFIPSVCCRKWIGPEKRHWCRSQAFEVMNDDVWEYEQLHKLIPDPEMSSGPGSSQCSHGRVVQGPG